MRLNSHSTEMFVLANKLFKANVSYSFLSLLSETIEENYSTQQRILFWQIWVQENHESFRFPKSPLRSYIGGGLEWMDFLTHNKQISEIAIRTENGIIKKCFTAKMTSKELEKWSYASCLSLASLINIHKNNVYDLEKRVREKIIEILDTYETLKSKNAFSNSVDLENFILKTPEKISKMWENQNLSTRAPYYFILYGSDKSYAFHSIKCPFFGIALGSTYYHLWDAERLSNNKVGLATGYQAYFRYGYIPCNICVTPGLNRVFLDGSLSDIYVPFI